MKRATYRCYHCGQEHEDGKRNPCENRGRINQEGGRTITLAAAKEKIVAAHARPALRVGTIAITPVPGHPEFVVVADGGTAALVEVRGRLLHDILDAACAADVWSDIEGMVDSD